MIFDKKFEKRPLGMRLAMVVRAWRSHINLKIVQTGLTQPGWTLLMQLQELGEKITITELAQAHGIELPPVLRIVSLLETQGLVLREHCPHDRRIKLISLTTEGRQILNLLNDVTVQEQEFIFQNIDAKDFTVFNKVLNQMAFNLKQSSADE